MCLGSFFGCTKSTKKDATARRESVLAYGRDGTTFDFSVYDGTKTQYIKKFDQFATTWGFVGDTVGTTRETSINQLSAVADLNAESMRFDLFMGYNGLGYNIANTYEKKGLTYEEYAASLQVIDRLNELSVAPQLVLFACPAYAQSYGSWKSKPIAEKWRELCYNMATYFKRNGNRIGAYEIWNEPDLGTAYFDGDWQDYIETYLSGADGIRSADKDAFIEALSASWIHKIVNNLSDDGNLTKWESFIKQAAEHNLLPDSISWHFYGREGKTEGIKGLSGDGEDFSVYRNAILKAITDSQNGTSARDATAYDLSTMQQNLNEFNIYVPLHQDSAGMWNTTSVVPGMFNAIEMLLEANDITRVNWATFLSEQVNGIGCSSIDTYSLQRYPAYYANWMYGRLPVRRIVQPSLESGLITLAASDNDRAGFIICNSASVTKTATVAFAGIPFEKANVKVYLVDEDHYVYSTSNEPYIAENYVNIETRDLMGRFTLKPNATYYVEINNAEGEATENALSSLYKNVVRKDYWYPERGNNTPYSDIHERSLLTVLSMNNNDVGSSAVSVTLRDMKEKTIVLSYDLFGEFVQAENAALGFQICFETGSGYDKSIYYTFEDYSAVVDTPLGGQIQRENVSLGALSKGERRIALSDIAPENWNGRIVVNYVISNCGKGATALFKMD